MSPKKKKIKTNNEMTPTKRQNNSDCGPSKRIKSENNPQEDILAKRRKNFVTACEQVSYKAYFNLKERLLLVYLPPCINNTFCKHQDIQNTMIRQMSPKAEEAFLIDSRTNMWCEALEVCLLSISPNQYLSAKVMKEIVEIMMNAHEDKYAGHSVAYLIDKCQLILQQNFSTHPPCFTRALKTCYNNFLMSPLDLRENTFSNRANYGSEKGIVKYCLNRLEYEISEQSIDDCLVDKYENIPQEMMQSVKGLHWQKEKFEIYECHKRIERIDRLMAVLDTIIELLQFDLAIWHGRYTNNLGSHIMRSHKPLLAYILWSDNILYTGAVNSNCRQLLKLFVYLIHLRYPEAHVSTMTTWLNAVIQTFYICETNSNSDYPNIGKYCTAFANYFYKIISELPQESITRVIEKIQPAYMRHIIGILHLQKLLVTEETCIIRMLINFIKESKWNNYPESQTEMLISEDTLHKPKKVKRKLRCLIKIFTAFQPEEAEEENKCYAKMESKIQCIEDINRNHVVHTLFTTLNAYLDAFSVQNVQETLDNLNDQLLTGETEILNENPIPELTSYTVTEQFIKNYRYIYQQLKELVILLQQMKSAGKLPDILKVFEQIDMLT